MSDERVEGLLRAHIPVQWADGWECEGCPLDQYGKLRNFDTYAEWVAHIFALEAGAPPLSTEPASDLNVVGDSTAELLRDVTDWEAVRKGSLSQGAPEGDYKDYRQQREGPQA